MKKYISLAFLIVFLGCSKDSDENSDPNQNLTDETISGVIVLPENSSIDSSILKVQSISATSSVIDSGYELVVVENVVNTLFAVDLLDQVILMGYTYPGQTDFTIDSGSTILAMLMNLPISQSLSTQGKVNLVNEIKNDPNF